MTKRKGVLVTWELNDIRTTAEHLSDKGFDRYLPSNGAKTALIKALKVFKKTNSDKIYRRWEDVKESANFTVFAEEVDGQSLKMNGEATVRLNKRSSELELLEGSGEAFEKIKELYLAEGPTLNTDQFRAIVKNVISEDLHGFSVRKGGGVYFIDERFNEGLKKLKELFGMFPMNARLHIIPVYNDDETLQTIEHHASEEMFSAIDFLIKDIDSEFSKGTINSKKLDSRKEKADEILTTITLHQENLRGEYEKVKSKLESVRKALESVTVKVEEGIQDSNDFMQLLGDL